jgi:hypothetical protein
MSMTPSMVLIEAAPAFILIIIALAAVWYLADKYEDNKCDGDCNQGRNCRCKDE